MVNNVDVNVALIALGGVLFTAIVGFVAAQLTNRSRDQELFQSALEFLSGGTQKRSIGIALLKSYGDEHPEKTNIIREIFRAQGLHLLDEGYGVETHGKRRVESYNFLRLKDVLAAWENEPNQDKAKVFADKEFDISNPIPAPREPERRSKPSADS